DLAIGKLLANYEQAGKLHDGFILTYWWDARSARPTSQSRLLPQVVPPALYFGTHRDHTRPRAREAFAGPLARGVDAHLRSVVGQTAGMVQRIHRAHHELYVALRVDIVQRLPRHLAVVLHVHVFIHYYDHLGKH